MMQSCPAKPSAELCWVIGSPDCRIRLCRHIFCVQHKNNACKFVPNSARACGRPKQTQGKLRIKFSRKELHKRPKTQYDMAQPSLAEPEPWPRLLWPSPLLGRASWSTLGMAKHSTRPTTWLAEHGSRSMPGLL